MFAPGAAGNDEGVERLPVDALTADHAVAAALERRADQVRALLQGQRALAGAQHLHEEGHGLVDGEARRRIDVFDHQRLVAVAVPVAKLLEQLAHHVVAVDVHGRGVARTAVVRDETRQEPAAAVDPLRIVRREALGLHRPTNALALLLLGVIVLEIHGVQGLDQRQIENAQVDGGLLALVAVVMPGVVRRQHEISGPEDDVLALDAREVHRAGEPQTDGIRRMAVRRHDFDRIVDAVGDVQRRGGGALRREARIHQDQRAPFRGLGLDQLRRSLSSGSICRLYFQMKGTALRPCWTWRSSSWATVLVHHPVRAPCCWRTRRGADHRAETPGRPPPLFPLHPFLHPREPSL